MLDELNPKANTPAVKLPIETLRSGLCDLIGYFRLPDERWSQETRQSSSGALKNRQNLFQEEVTSAAKDYGLDLCTCSAEINGHVRHLYVSVCVAHVSFYLRVLLL